MGRPPKSYNNPSSNSKPDIQLWQTDDKGKIIELNPKQVQFMTARQHFICFGGAKRCGKTFAVRFKAVGAAAIQHPGIKILIMRHTYPELEENHIRPIKTMCAGAIEKKAVTYNDTKHIMDFWNGSMIKFGHYGSDAAENEYQGQEYDWIFMDEATQFTERQFTYLCGCLGGATPFPKRMYLTCNPGGVGHRWVKRLFIDRKFVTDDPNPEKNENPDDYVFIPATIEDNEAFKLINKDGYNQYLRDLAKMPNGDAFRYGKWDEMSGAYFKGFGMHHIYKKTDGRYIYPPGWDSFIRYRALDYGFDMTACLWVAIDHDGRCYVYREFNQGEDNNQPGLITSEAAKAIKSHTLPQEKIATTIVPPDLWKRGAVDGKCAAEDLMLNGISIWKSNNDRVQGGMQIREMMQDAPDGKPWLMIFEDCKDLIANLTDIQADEKDLNKYSNEPHDVTHNVDALRYFCISRTLPTEREEEPYYPEPDEEEDYDSFMTGGEMSRSYLNY
jgi:phage terminase large subunit